MGARRERARRPRVGLREGAAEDVRRLHREYGRGSEALHRRRGQPPGEARVTTANNAHQMYLLQWAEDLEAERAQLAAANAERRARRGFIVIATDPSVSTDSPDYRQVDATEARTAAKATAKVRPLAEGRRLRAYLATGMYKHELAEARWVA